MNNRKYIKFNFLERNDAPLYLIMQSIVSFFIFIVVNITKQVDLYSDVGIELSFLIKTIVIFTIMCLFNVKYTLSINKSASILSLCFLFDYFIHILYFSDYSLILILIRFLFITFLPFFLLSLYKYIYNKYIVLIEKTFSCKQKLYFNYIFMLIIIFLLNIIIPLFISLFIMVVDFQTFFMIFILYQVLLSKFLPLIAMLVAIKLQKSRFYIKKIAPYLVYFVTIGGGIDIILYSQASNVLFDLKNNITIPISFLATFLPMYLVYVLSNIIRKYN